MSGSTTRFGLTQALEGGMKIVVTAAFIALVACSPRVAVTWEARCDELVPGKYRACYGPGWVRPSSGERPYENFQVSLERTYETNSHVMVSRTFSTSQVPPELLVRYPPSVVTFDRTTGKVIFKVGAETVIGYVPPPPSNNSFKPKPLRGSA